MWTRRRRRTELAKAARASTLMSDEQLGVRAAMMIWPWGRKMTRAVAQRAGDWWTPNEVEQVGHGS